MKKILLLLVVTIAFLSCKSNKNPVSSKKITEEQEEFADPVSKQEALKINAEVMAIKGNWTLTKVSYPNSNKTKITSFQIADCKCFLGSQWNFVSNINYNIHNKGDFSMKAKKCSNFKSKIVWSVSKEKIFTLKFLKDKSGNDVKLSYYLFLYNQKKNSFDLSDDITINGKAIQVVYHFERNVVEKKK